MFAYDILQSMKSICIRGGTVLSMDKDFHVYEPGMIIIEDGLITYAGPEKKVSFEGHTLVDGSDHIIIPGLINTHTHLGMSLFRTLGDDKANRLRDFIFPLERKMVSAELVYWASLHSLSEMILGGTTTCADMYYFSSHSARAADTIGMRAIIGQSVTTQPAADAESISEAIGLVKDLESNYKGHPLITAAIAPHAPYTLSREDARKCAANAEQLNLPILSHLAEMPFEQDYTIEHFGMRPVDYYNSIGLLGDRAVMAHCIHVNESDISLLKATNTGIAHNPSANSKSGKGTAPAYRMFKQDVRIGLGTDGPMSVNSIDLVSQLNITAKMQKQLEGDPVIMGAQDVLYMATMGGARALHMEQQIGSLEAGKFADITMISTQSPRLYPVYNPYSAVVYCAAASDVSTVFIHGRCVLKKGHLQTADTDEIREAAGEFTEKIRSEFS
jgi:cytosine/adenosine deaminase-related metal-dependent hydrolase